MALAELYVLHEGYGDGRVAATTCLIVDGDRRIITDPGMVRDRRLLLDPLAEAGFTPDSVTDVVLSHHHPDHTLNAALFQSARVHDHWAIYCGDTWTWRDADGYAVSDNVTLVRTPGHTDQDITTVAVTDQDLVAVTHLWNTADSAGDRHATDLAQLHANRDRVLRFATLVVPGHGPAFRPTGSTPR
jgi:glyoxylase-like metal-dependent hydrolase (beta-lactamase superfamily II)